ncbi:MAG: aldolase/citrate lyase family protein [Alphaproteobacteria bacterium]|nr:aldolase/citrate lyase family protein [Alphaproteobacteria bacterium]
MFRQNALKRRLRKGNQAFGMFLELGHPPIAEIAAASGYDCVLIDREHGQGDLFSAVPEMAAAQAHGATALLRVPANDPVTIKLALDTGPEGIMIPAILDGAAAKRAADSCRYPPRGIRGFAASVVRASSYGVHTEAYLREIEDELLVIGQIETRSGVEAAEAIAATDGIDMIFIGPYDLAANLGHLGEPDHKDALKAIARVEKAAKKHGKWLGAIPTPGRSAAALFQDGYDLVISHCDVVMLREAARADVAAMRAALKRRGAKKK